MTNENDQEHTTFYDHADRPFERIFTSASAKKKAAKKQDKETLDEVKRQVRETEDASLQDDSYSFDESNTDNEEYHDVSDATDYDFENEDDLHP